MTLVASLARAATDDIENLPKEKSLIEYEKNNTTDIRLAENNSTNSYFFPYKSSFSVRTGLGLNFDELNKTEGNKKLPILLGAQYMLESENSKHQEYGINFLHQDNPKLYVHGGYKYIIDSTEDLRPYFKMGAAVRFDEGDYLETPFDFKSYSLVVSTGLEDITSDPNSIRVDLDLHWGKEDFLAICSLGWSTAF